MNDSKGAGISIVIPYRASVRSNERQRNLHWLERYWKENLPEAEFMICDDPDKEKVFSKSAAINHGVAQTTGDILILVDADGYIEVERVIHCAREIRNARSRGRRLWFVPYRKFYRLGEIPSLRLLSSDPKAPHVFPEPMNPLDTNNYNNASTGHWYGAMIQIVPREAFDLVGGWDERFRGWGGEDHAAMSATDTLYWPHKTLPTRVLHIWHPMIGLDGVQVSVVGKDRHWEGQANTVTNNTLSWRYYYSTNKPHLMRRLVDECKHRVHPRTHPICHQLSA